MKKYTRKLGKVIKIDEKQNQEHLGKLVRGTIDERLLSVYRPTTSPSKIHRLRIFILAWQHSEGCLFVKSSGSHQS